MNRTLATAATGLQAQQVNIERISNDLANVNTDGYKRGRTEFSDLMYETIKRPGQQLGANSISPVGVQVGTGVKVGASHKVLEQGTARMTYHPYDIMIEGDGYFPIQQPNGEIGYTRHGAFHLDPQRRLVQSNGSLLLPQVTVPNDALSVTINSGGEVVAVLPGNQQAIIGQLQLVKFANEQGLLSEGSQTFKVTEASGPPIQGVPAENGFGYIQQGALEGSNVDVAKSMVDMITTQRAYEMGTKMMGVADEMMKATVNVR